MPAVTITYGAGSDITDWLGLVVSVLGFSSGLIVLWLAKRNIDAILRQIRSQSLHQAIEAHKSLYLPIIQDEHLSTLVGGSTAPAFRRELLASILINHAGRVFAEIREGNLADLKESAFLADFSEFYRWPLIRDRWPHVRQFHPVEFAAFVDDVDARVRADEEQAKVQTSTPGHTQRPEG